MQRRRATTTRRYELNGLAEFKEQVQQLQLQQQVLVVGSGGAGGWFRIDIDLVYLVSQMKRNGKVRN